VENNFVSMREKILSISQALNIHLDDNYLKLLSGLEILLRKINNRSIFHKLKITPKGFYIHGLTGSGKTTLMNVFFEAIKTKKKINMHFHDYFLDISRLLTKYSLPQLVELLGSKLEVLCFDEFFIENIADAKLLQDLLEGLIKKGVIIVLTSNFIPEKLYEDGFNRELIFPKFSDFLKQNLHVHNLSHNFDFREKKHEGTSIVMQKIPEIEGLKDEILHFQNHKLSCTYAGGTAIFEYSELFQKPRGVNEFIYICRKFQTIYIQNFKPFNAEDEDEIIRFRNFIDVAYLRHTFVFLEGSFEQEELFPHSSLQNIKIKRTFSRILEMSSVKFLSNINSFKRKWHNEARLFLENL
jgi:cell division protein ZapE